MDGRIVLINKVAENLTGWGLKALGRKIIEVFFLVDEQTREHVENPVERVLQTGKVLDLPTEALLLARDDEERAVAARAAPIFDAAGQISGAVLVFQDVTEKQKLEVEMVKASRIESLGLLAGGIAHDFNNIMTGILGNVSLARMFAPAEPELQERLEQAEKACLRARDLTQQLLAFAKGGNLLKRTAFLSELIAAAGRGGIGHGLFDHQEARRRHPGGIRAGGRDAIRGLSSGFDSCPRASEAGVAPASHRIGQNSGHG